jgi:tetratricopeptide (TPR) repeat protein
MKILRVEMVLLLLMLQGSVIFAAAVFSSPISAVPEQNCTVYGGYLSGDIDMFVNGIAEQERKYRASGRSDDLYILVVSRYGYIGYLLSLNNNREARRVLDDANENLETLKGDRSFRARATAMEGALMAMRISLNPLRATYLGARSMSLMEEALDIDNREPVAWVEMGNARFHAPGFAGGSKEEAVKCFSEAVRLFEADERLLKCNWHYLHALVWLAKSHEETGNLQSAKRIYEKLLSIEPQFMWVKQELYPQLLRRMGEQ